MEGGKLKTSAELEEELKKVLADNEIYYMIFTFFGLFLGLSTLALHMHDLVSDKIVMVILPSSLGFIGFVFPLYLNFLILDCLNLGERDQVLKWFRWEIVAALLVVQPRAYFLMKGLLRRVEVEEEERSAV